MKTTLKKGASKLEVLVLVSVIILGVILLSFLVPKPMASNTDRSSCIVNLRTHQLAMRAYQNISKGRLDLSFKVLFEMDFLDSEDGVNSDLRCRLSDKPYRINPSFIPVEEGSPYPAKGQQWVVCPNDVEHVPADSYLGNW